MTEETEAELPEKEKTIRNTERYGDICEANYKLIYEDKQEERQQTISEVLEILKELFKFRGRYYDCDELEKKIMELKGK